MVSQHVAGVPPVIATGDSEAVASLRASPEGWEIIFCVYTMISLNSPTFLALNQSRQIQPKSKEINSVDFSNHQQWNHQSGWKNTLNNLRLIIQPLFLFWMIYPWLDIFSNPPLLLGFNRLINAMNQLNTFLRFWIIPLIYYLLISETDRRGK